jgi:hypothetical protein
MVRARGVLVFALVCGWLMSGIGFAWEFNLQGQTTWKYQYYSQQGRLGFFGPYDIDEQDTGGIFNFASMNAWLGSQLAQGFKFATVTTGADASLSTMQADFYPEIKINEAIRVRGRYHIGAWNSFLPELLEPLRLADLGIARLENSHYRNSTLQGVTTSFSPGYWNLFWVTARTPMGIIGFGKRPWAFGCGFMFDGAENTSTESFQIVAPYGPLRIGLFVYPWRESPLAQNWGAGYLEQTDKSNAASVWVGGFTTYEAGNLTIGVMNQYVTAHAGAESQIFQFAKDQYIGADMTLNNGGAFVKFNNGRFFFNAELDWYDQTLRRRSNVYGFPDIASFGDGSYFAPNYIEHWRYMAEFGVVSGPAKVSFLAAHIPGPDRRNGALIDRQPALLTTNRILFEYNKQLTSTSVFKPYSMLLSTNYGGGLNSISKAREGHMNDANVLAARVDYAVAANLNTFASAFYAKRASKGYGWGLIRPIPGLGVLYTPPIGPAGFGLVQPPIQWLNDYIQTLLGGGGFGDPGVRAPAIPDDALGLEIDAGFSWKILESYVIDGNFGIWWPGKWFNYACVDKSNVNGWFIASPANNWGVVNANRTIDPIFGTEISIKVEF